MVTPNIIGIVTRTKVQYLIPIEKEPQWYDNGNGERVNAGKSYQDYINEYITRKKK